MFDVASAMSLSDTLNEIVLVVKIRDYLICFSNSYRYGRVVQIPHFIQLINHYVQHKLKKVLFVSKNLLFFTDEQH